MARFDYSNIPTKVEQLTEEQQKEYRRLVVSYPNLNEENLVFLAWLGEERYRNWITLERKTKMPTIFFVYSLVSNSPNESLPPSCLTRLTIEECIEDFESIVRELNYHIIWDDFETLEDEYKCEFHLATTYSKSSTLKYWNFQDWYISKSYISILPDSTFVTAKNEIIQW